MRKLGQGALRNLSDNKYAYERFFDPEVLHTYAAYMHKHRRIKGGAVREPDNWKLGITESAWIDSLIRHTMDLWRLKHGYTVIDPDTGKPTTAKDLLCAILFNTMGLLYEQVKLK